MRGFGHLGTGAACRLGSILSTPQDGLGLFELGFQFGDCRLGSSNATVTVSKGLGRDELDLAPVSLDSAGVLGLHKRQHFSLDRLFGSGSLLASDQRRIQATEEGRVGGGVRGHDVWLN